MDQAASREDIAGQGVPIPHSVVRELMSAEEESLQVQWGKHVINLRYPLGHTVVVGVLGLKRELQESPKGCCGKLSAISTDAAVASKLA